MQRPGQARIRAHSGFEVCQEGCGRHSWHVIAGDGGKSATSCERFASRDEAERAAGQLRMTVSMTVWRSGRCAGAVTQVRGPTDDVRSTRAVGARACRRQRLNAVEARLAGNRVYMTDLYDDIAAAQSTYVGLALTAGATLRAVLWGAQHG